MNQEYIILIITIISIYLISVLLKVIANKKVKNTNVRHLIRKWLQYGKYLIILIVLIVYFVDDYDSITTIFGFASAGVALALHPVFMNIAGWLLIIIKKPFGIGDRIEVNNLKGDIIDIQMFFTLVLEVSPEQNVGQSTGRVVTIPNSYIFTNSMYNATIGFNGLWNEMKITITLDSNKDKAKKIISEIIHDIIDEKMMDQIKAEQKEMAKKYAIKVGHLTPVTYFSIVPSGIQIEIRYLTLSRSKRGVTSALYERIYDAFNHESDISLAYPSQKIYFSNDNKPLD